MTLKEVGGVMGVTKERIRQLQSRAMGKLRQAAIAEGVEVPDNCPDPQESDQPAEAAQPELPDSPARSASQNR